VIERAVVMSEQSAISHGDIRLPRPAPRVTSFREMKAGMIAQFERSYIHSLLRAHDGNITRAARTAQKDPRALRQLMRKHQIDGRSFRPRA